MEKIKVLIADDHTFIREAFKEAISSDDRFIVVGTVENGAEACDKVLIENLDVDVILMDILMPVMNGISATRDILANKPDMKILIITAFNDDDRASEAIQVGAKGFITKNASRQEILTGLIEVSKGNFYVTQEIEQKLITLIRLANPGSKKLTNREMDILQKLGEGKTNQVIAEELGLSEGTIRVHISNLLRKLNLRSRIQAAIFAQRYKPN
ncbi:MAG TPA: response regulator transcription factor [Anaerolineales bacterium]|nr:response regulator transcription factor [Anaerolineales bacterium]